MKRYTLLTYFVIVSGVIAACSGSSQLRSTSTPPSMLKPGDTIGEMVLTTEQGNTPWIWDYCDPLATTTTECKVPALTNLFIGYGNVADTIETLNSEWTATNWELIFDGHPIDLSTFGTKDYDTGQKYRMWNIALDKITSGKHTLRYIISFNGQHSDITWNFTVASPVSQMELPENAAQLAFNGSSNHFANLAEFNSLLQSAVQSGEIDSFWDAVTATGQMPLIFGDRQAVFLYRGKGDTVAWKGDFTMLYTRQGQTDLWALPKEFEPDTRLDYKIQVDNETAVLDPLNLFTQPGGYGPNSVVRMPAYIYPEITLARVGIQHGLLSEDLPFSSKKLGYDVNYRVYTPAGYETMGNLPVAYVTDGQDFANPDFGAMVIVLDNLIADQKIKPLMAVFIDPRNPLTGVNRRQTELVPVSREICVFCEFIAEELVPEIDTAYKTHASPDARAVIGFSLGGQFTAQMGLTYSNVFHLIAIQSPYMLGHAWVFQGYETTGRLPLQVFLSHGSYDEGADSLRLRDTLQKKGYPLLYVETHDGHSWGNIRGILDDMLIYFFGRV